MFYDDVLCYNSLNDILISSDNCSKLSQENNNKTINCLEDTPLSGEKTTTSLFNNKNFDFNLQNHQSGVSSLSEISEESGKTSEILDLIQKISSLSEQNICSSTNNSGTSLKDENLKFDKKELLDESLIENESSIKNKLLYQSTELLDESSIKKEDESSDSYLQSVLSSSSSSSSSLTSDFDDYDDDNDDDNDRIVKTNEKTQLEKTYDVMNNCETLKLNQIIIKFDSNLKKFITNTNDLSMYEINYKKLTKYSGSITLCNVKLDDNSFVSLKFYLKNENNTIVAYIKSLNPLLSLQPTLERIFQKKDCHFVIINNSKFKIQNINCYIRMNFDNFILFFHSLKNITKCEQFSSQESTGQFLFEESLGIEKHKPYAKLMFKLYIHCSRVSFTYEKNKMFCTALFGGDLESVKNVETLLMLFQKNNDNTEFIQFSQNLFSKKESCDFTNGKQLKRKCENPQSIESNNTFTNKRQKHNLFSDKNEMIYIQNIVSLFKLLQSISLLLTPITDLFLNLLDHSLSINFDDSNINTNLSNQIKDFLKTSKIDGVLKSKKIQKIFEKLFEKDCPSLLQLNNVNNGT